MEVWYIDVAHSKELKVNDLKIMGFISINKEENIFLIKKDDNFGTNNLLIRINSNIYIKNAVTYLKFNKVKNET